MLDYKNDVQYSKLCKKGVGIFVPNIRNRRKKGQKWLNEKWKKGEKKTNSSYGKSLYEKYK